MDLRLDGKRALVTGSTAGIGYAIAEGLRKKAQRSSSTAEVRSARRSSRRHQPHDEHQGNWYRR